MKTWLVACATAMMPCALSEAQPAHSEITATHVNAWTESGQFSGAIRVQRPGATAVSEVRGVADDTTGRPITQDTPFYIASTSKAFTAVLVLQQVERGRIDLDEPIAEVFPELERAVSLRITPRHLLSHTAGLTREFAEALPPQDQYALEDVLRAINTAGLMFEPGSQEAYSNTGYILLAALLERQVGLSYAELLQAYIAAPAGLVTTTVTAPADVARGYTVPDALSRVPYDAGDDTQAGLLGTGGLYSTTQDLFAFITALAGGDLLGMEMQALILTPVEVNGAPGSGGMGLSFYPTSTGGRLVSASGAGRGTLSFLAWLEGEPERRMVSLVNDSRLGRGGSFPFYIGLLQIMLGVDEGTDPVATPMADMLATLQDSGEDAALDMIAGLDWSSPPVSNAAASQATGAPDGGVGETMYAWAPETADAGEEWLRLRWSQPVEATSLRVQFSQVPGVITGLGIGDAPVEAREEPDVMEYSEEGAPIEVYALTHGETSQLTLHLDTRRQAGWPQIDAVGLVDRHGVVHWADEAAASTSAFMSGDVSIHDLPSPENLIRLALRLEETGHGELAGEVRALSERVQMPE